MRRNEFGRPRRPRRVTLAVRASGRAFPVHCNVTPQTESLGAARANHTSHGAPDSRANILPKKRKKSHKARV
jgi:hypothetical protein